MSLSIGVIIAISLLSGINIGIETIARGALKSYVDNAPYDVSIDQTGNETSYYILNQRLTGVSNVAQVETVLSWTPPGRLELSGLPPANPPVALVGLSGDFQSRYNVTMVSGSWNLTSGVILPKQIAQYLNAKAGDSLRLTFYFPRTFSIPSADFWLRIAGVAAFSGKDLGVISGNLPSLTSSGLTGNPSTSKDFVGFSYDNLLNVYNDIIAIISPGFYRPFGVFHAYDRVFVDRPKVLNLFDPAATLAKLQVLEGQVNTQSTGFTTVIADPLAQAIQGYQSWLTSNLLNLFTFSLPVLPVSWYLAMTSWFIITLRRRREIGLLRVRGASSRNVFAVTLLEAGIVGVVGSVVGLLGGYVLGAIVSGTLGINPVFAFTLGALTPDIALILVSVGVFISILASLQPARMAASLSPLDAGKEYVAEEEEVSRPWRPTWTWIAVLLGVYKIAEWLLNLGPLRIFPYGPPSNNIAVEILFFLWSTSSNGLNFLGPLLFVYGITKILTRSNLGLYERTTLILKPFLKDLARISTLAMSRNPARISRVAFLIALTLTFGVFLNVILASNVDLQAQTVKLSVGADLVVKAAGTGLNLSLARNLSSIGGITTVTPVVSGSVVTPKFEGQNALLYAIRPDEFFKTAYYSNNPTAGFTDSVLQLMRQNASSALITESLARSLQINVGETVYLDLESIGSTINFPVTIIGFQSYLPGVNYPSDGIPNFITVSLPYLLSRNYTAIGGLTLLTRLAPNADPSKIANMIQSQYANETSGVMTVQAKMNQLLGDPLAVGSYRFLQLVATYFFGAAIVGFALISWANTQERLGDIAMLRTRGSTRNQILKLLFAEAFALLVIATVIGISTGLITAYGVVRVLPIPATTAFFGISFRVLVPLDVWIGFVTAVAAFLLSIGVATWLSLRQSAIKTIRFH